MRALQAYPCCNRMPETVERDLLYGYQGLKDRAWDAEPVEDNLPLSIPQRASNLHCAEELEDKIKAFQPRGQRLIRNHLHVFGELPSPAPVTSWYSWNSS